MNKSDVVGRVAESAGVTKQQAESVIEEFFSTVKSAVKGGDRVLWPSFGSFSQTERSARTGRNPSTGEPLKIPASRAVKFSQASALKEFMSAKAAGPGKKATAGKSAAAKSSASTKAAATRSPAKSPAKKAPTKATKAAKKR